MELRVKVLSHGEGLPLPAYQTDGSAGFDLLAALSQPVIIKPRQWMTIPTGIIIEVPRGFEGSVRGRSGNGVRHGISVVHGVGTVDSDYRGEVFAAMINHGDVGFMVRRGDRIAQVIISPVQRVAIVEVDDLTETARGDGGFGSTGVR